MFNNNLNSTIELLFYALFLISLVIKFYGNQYFD